METEDIRLMRWLRNGFALMIIVFIGTPILAAWLK